MRMHHARGKIRRLTRVLTVITALLAAPPASMGGEKVLLMSTTTSTENSGLLDVLLPAFTQETGIKVKVLAKGTGAALRDGMDGNVDVLFVHAREREEQFVAEGYGTKRWAVMHNDFIIVGPAGDPAGIRGVRTAAQALKKIAGAKAGFVSRGDDSGTHTKEQALWRETGLPLESEKREIVKEGKRQGLRFYYPAGLGQWYFSIGQGMGKTLTYAEETQAYTLTDRGTYLKYKYGRPGGLDLEILCEGDPALYNPYGVIPVNPERHAHAKFEWARTFAEWLVSPRAQALIAGYRIEGRPAFFPDAVPRAE